MAEILAAKVQCQWRVILLFKRLQNMGVEQDLHQWSLLSNMSSISLANGVSMSSGTT